MPESDRTAGKLTLATEAELIIREENVAVASAELAALTDDELRRRVHTLLAKHIGDDDTDLPGYLPDPAAMPREEMIVLLADDAVDCPPTFAIPEDADDPLVGAARKLRREGWERNVVEIIRVMKLNGPAAARHREMAQQAELDLPAATDRRNMVAASG